MKNLILLLTFFAITHAAAEGKKVVNNRMSDSKWGQFNLEVRDLGEPVQQPFKLTLRLSCKDQRVKSKEELILEERVCEYRGYTFDEKLKTLTLHYSTLSELKANEYTSQCGDDWTQTFDLKLLCEKGKP